MTTAIVILAGGQARRMGGGDKCRQIIAGQTILHRTRATLALQSPLIALNANDDLARFADTQLPVLPDPLPGHPGPLAGVLAGLEWAATQGMAWLLSVPGDCPFLPKDLLSRLHEARQAADATYAVASSDGRTHPVAGLWPTWCRDELRTALLAGDRKIDAFTARHPTATATWPTTPHDPFFNVNTRQDVEEANRLARDA